ncbi:MAG TPA: glycosyltransferase family 4 protein [Vicinamibacterales bacterium]|nr:glycosyltransferase family 4 protein [Vicinamibacterales bacterium]
MSSATAPRILHLVPALFGAHGIIGGAERYVLNLARAMATQVPTTLVTFGEQSDERREGDLRLRVIGNPWYVRGQKTNPWSLSILSEVSGVDVVHCHQQHTLMSSTAAAACRLSRRRVFATDLGGGGWDISAYVSTDRWFDGHLHLSEYSRRVFGHDGKPWARVILGGVDTTSFSPAPGVERNGAPLFVGRILPHKGIGGLIDALPERMPLDVIGPVSDPDTLEQLKTKSAGKTVRFHHDCDDAALVGAYRRALCVVLPSVYRTPDGRVSTVPELLGQTLLEAMACGTPAICTRVASMPEIVEDGKTGFIVEPGDRDGLRERLEWLAANPVEAMRLGEAGRRVVLERFQWHHVVQRCLEAYHAS